jgi:alanyl-tRNA synthetase
MVESANPDDDIEVLLAATPFYAESGGQVSDTGAIRNGQEWLIEITGVSKPIPGMVIHTGRVVEGKPVIGDPATATVDRDKRRDIMRNHTATHLLHRELRAVLGDHVLQQGSLVAPDRLRFDFNHTAAVSPDELADIERRVNKAVLENYPVTVGHTSLADAKERGAMALFGEKYGEIVRTIQVGGPEHPYSMELCGGTHVNKTAEIGLFHILNEGSVGANLRRVEAVTGSCAQKLVQKRLQVLDNAAARLNTSPAEVELKIDNLLNEVQSAHKEIERLQRELARGTFTRLLDSNVRQAAGTPVLTAVVDAASIDSMREIADWFRDKAGSGVAALGAEINGRPMLIVAVTQDLVKRGLKAGDLIRPAAKLIGGGGGGKPTLAQAGGKDSSQLEAAVSLVFDLVIKELGDH